MIRRLIHLCNIENAAGYFHACTSIHVDEYIFIPKCAYTYIRVQADRLVRCCPMSCFDIEDFGGHRKAIVSDKVCKCTYIYVYI